MVSAEALLAIDLPAGDAYHLPTSSRRFDDETRWRVEIPSVEGPEAMEAVLETADEIGVTIHRISQGSGIMLQTDDEIRQMVAMGHERGVEVSLFTGPRAAWDTGVQASSSGGGAVSASLRGADQLAYAIDDIQRGCEMGLRGVVVADIGLLMVIGRLKETGALPSDLGVKVSVSLPVANPASARLMEDLGATSINLPVDLSLPQIAAIREAVDIVLDIYIEAPDELGGPLRYYEISELARIASPVYLKFGLRNAAGIYPSGKHLRDVAVRGAQERVRRAAIGLALLERQSSAFTVSEAGAKQGLEPVDATPRQGGKRTMRPLPLRATGAKAGKRDLMQSPAGRLGPPSQ